MMQKILVPLDGSDFAEGIIDEVADLAAGGRAEVVLFQVGTLPQELVVDNGRTIYLDEQLGWVESGIKDYLRMVERRLKARGLRVESAMSFGDPVAEILRYAREKDVTLIAMATHGRTGLEAIWRGSVARDVYQKASVPVLLKRRSVKEAGLRAA